MAERIVQVTSSEKRAQHAANSELMSPPGLHDVLKTLEHFGIYQRFECIKCHQELSTINLALAHLRGEYLECKTGNVGESTLSAESTRSRKEKEVFAPRKPKSKSARKVPSEFSPKSAKKEVPSSSSKSKYSLKQIEMILSKKKKDNVFAKQFDITTRDVAKLRYNWNKSGKYNNLLVTEVHRVKKQIKNYKEQKVPKGSQEYKVESADDK